MSNEFTLSEAIFKQLLDGKRVSFWYDPESRKMSISLHRVLGPCERRPAHTRRYVLDWFRRNLLAGRIGARWKAKRLVANSVEFHEYRRKYDERLKRYLGSQLEGLQDCQA